MRPPYFWSAGLDPRSRDAAPMLRLLLTPAAALYAGVTARKIRTVTPQKVSVPVICIGNVTVGGTGKTPAVAAVLAHLRAMGLRAASLSRGYGGSLRGPLKADAARHAAGEIGDEPLMLAQSGEAWIGRDRFEAAVAMAKDGVGIIVMDDGHQNPSLHKDLSIVVVDAAEAFGNGFVVPKGPLRETVAAGLARADAVFLAGSDDVPEDIVRAGKPVLRFHLKPTGPIPIGPLLAFAGIGRPLKFFDALKAAGADVCDAIAFDDHHPYTLGDLRSLTTHANHLGARLITTEKDFVRLPSDLRPSVLTFPVHAIFDDPAALGDLLRQAIERRAS